MASTSATDLMLAIGYLLYGLLASLGAVFRNPRYQETREAIR